jgi:GNAT superfamily N-acetyltransferase
MENSPAARIRPYDPAADYPALRDCFLELQAWERQFEPAMPAPEDAADPYLADMLGRCAASGGRVFVADEAGAIVGFICLMAKVGPDFDDSLAPYSYISDLVVRAAHRRRGTGRRLIAAAEAFARDAGMKRLKVAVLIPNEGAHDLYRRCGFRDVVVQLVKDL